MSDDELRALGREVAASGGASARLRYARALERAGRRDEALEALVPARDDPDVRREIGRFPAFGLYVTPDFDLPLASTGHVDVPPIVRTPRVLWRSLGRSRADHLLASELGVAALRFNERLFVLDPSNGSLLWELPALSGETRRYATLLADVLVVVEADELAAFDLRTGEGLYRLPRDDLLGEASIGVASGLWLAQGQGLLAAFAHEDPRRPPSSAVLWKRRLVVSSRSGRPRGSFATRRLVVVGEDDEIVALDPRSGEVRWRAPGARPLADDRGVIAWIPDRKSGRPRGGPLAGYDLDGRRAFLFPRFGLPHALGPSVVVARRDAEPPPPSAALGAVWIPPRLALVRRDDGGLVGELAELAFAVALARGVVYGATDRRVHALADTGEELWRIDHAGVAALAPLAHRLLVLNADGAVTCYAEP